MGRNKRREKQELQLADAKQEFEALLRACLPESARGRWGLFDQRDSIHTSEHKLPHDRHVKRMERLNAALDLLDDADEPDSGARGLPDGDMAPRSRERGWVEADQLRELAVTVMALRERVGEIEPWLPLDAWLRACRIKGSNAPGEPRLAAMVIEELAAADTSR
jgi:hypothetical protein